MKTQILRVLFVAAAGFALILFILNRPRYNLLIKDIAENTWLYVPAACVLVFAGVSALLLRMKSSKVQRWVRLFGLGMVAALATLVFGAFAFSFIILQPGKWLFPSDAVWITGGIFAGCLATWLWVKFCGLCRQALHSPD